MILEGVLTTRDLDGKPRIAPMGPRFLPGAVTFTLRPFPGSRSCENLLRERVGVFHVTDDSELIARSSVSDVTMSLIAATQIAGFLIPDSCRYWEFEVTSVEEGERLKMECKVVATEMLREFYGFNRARHAVVEAAILATRWHLLPVSEIFSEFQKFRTIITKTGGEAEQRAIDFLEATVRERLGVTP